VSRLWFSRLEAQYAAKDTHRRSGALSGETQLSEKCLTLPLSFCILHATSSIGLLERELDPRHAQLSELFRLYVPLPLVGEAAGRDARG